MMGCDIHAYIEYADKGRDNPYWVTIADRSNPGRNYDVFAKLAGVRTSDPSDQMVDTRGLPADASLTAKWDNQLYVSDDLEGDEYTTLATAERWVADGYSAWTDDRRTAVTQPDWHSHSWCTPAELRAVLEAPADWPAQPSYWAILAALEELERRDCLARLVFWFDN